MPEQGLREIESPFQKLVVYGLAQLSLVFIGGLVSYCSVICHRLSLLVKHANNDYNCEWGLPSDNIKQHHVSTSHIV